MSQHGVHADILKREAQAGGPREHFQTSDANDFASAKETAQSTFSDQRQAQDPSSFGQADRFNAGEIEGSQKQPTLTERLQGVQQAASIVTGSQSQEKGGQRQVPVSNAALKASQAETRAKSS
ncbi:hypothetical protein FB107DRAFT_203310 [Schizophyllum commune]